MAIQAKVEWFNRTRGYGFARAEGIDGDILLHQSAIEMEGFRFLKPNQAITITEVETTERGVRAVRIVPND